MSPPAGEGPSPTPTTADAERVAAVVPRSVIEVCRTLGQAGFEAVTVGGAVRDALLGRVPGDWDVATSALPEEVISLFPHTIPTGLQHGTVTVVVGRGRDRGVIEVTTYRGEGTYTDARRPDSVRFGVPLREDLARRDFVINAIAFDPVACVLVDPFDGRGDLAARRVRAVGKAVERFTEDGLRVMRAVRFSATLGFALDEETLAGIRPALPSLRRVAWERIWIELDKTLRAPRPGASLVIAEQQGILAYVLPEALIGTPEDFARRLAILDEAATVPARLTVLLSGASAQAARAAMLRLKTRKADQAAVAHALTVDSESRGRVPANAAELRRLARRIGRDAAPLVLECWAARSRALGDAQLAALVEAVGATVRGDAPLTVAELAVTGKDLLGELGRPPGPWIGKVLEALLEVVLEDPANNDRAGLLGRAQGLVAALEPPPNGGG